MSWTSAGSLHLDVCKRRIVNCLLTALELCLDALLDGQRHFLPAKTKGETEAPGKKDISLGYTDISRPAQCDVSQGCARVIQYDYLAACEI